MAGGPERPRAFYAWPWDPRTSRPLLPYPLTSLRSADRASSQSGSGGTGTRPSCKSPFGSSGESLSWHWRDFFGRAHKTNRAINHFDIGTCERSMMVPTVTVNCWRQATAKIDALANAALAGALGLQFGNPFLTSVLAVRTDWPIGPAPHFQKFPKPCLHRHRLCTTNFVKTDSSAFICMVFMPTNLADTPGHPQSMHLLSIQTRCP